MILRVLRTDATPTRTIGELYIDGSFAAWTLEDAIREEKIPGETCIPPGRYRVLITKSARFNRMLPVLVDVPEFHGVRMHGGNDAQDTSGCILVGSDRGDDAISACAEALNTLLRALAPAQAAGEDVWIEIRNPPTDRAAG